MDSLPGTFRVTKSISMTWEEHVKNMREMWKAEKVLTKKLQGKRSMGRFTNGREDNIKIYIK
jgi:hypothetical protein